MARSVILSFDEYLSDTKEKVGQLLGVSGYTGDALIFYILTKEEISKSVVKPYDSQNDPNLQAEKSDE